MTTFEIITKDNIEAMKEMEAESIHNCITDSPWSINFLSRDWDNIENYQLWTQRWAQEVYRLLKPGGFILAMCGTRTYHRLCSGIEDAGFEIKDTISHIFASGFPKSQKLKDCPNWEGWQTPGLKPSQAFVIVSQKPREGSYANNMNKYHVGCFNIDATRIPHNEDLTTNPKPGKMDTRGFGWGFKKMPRDNSGRFPSNFTIDEETAEELDAQSGIKKAGKKKHNQDIKRKGMKDDGASFTSENTGWDVNKCQGLAEYGDAGGASRFFFTPKASQREKNAGCEDITSKPLNGEAPQSVEGKCPTCSAPLKEGKTCKFHPAVQGSRDYNARCKNCGKKFIGSPNTICSCDNPQTDNTVYKMKNNHPTVQSIEFFKYIIKLVAAPHTTILDPFNGSGTTGCAVADLENDYHYIGIEKDPHYSEISKARIQNWIDTQPVDIFKQTDIDY